MGYFVAFLSQSYKQERGCLVHFACLANTLLKDEESARDKHIFACIAKYSPILKKFTDRLSNRMLLIWLLTTPPHLKYVATQPCNVSLIACFLTLIFHNLVWQDMQGVVGFLNNDFRA